MTSWWPSNAPRATVAALAVMMIGVAVVARAVVKEVAAPGLILSHDPLSLSPLLQSLKLSPKPAQTLMSSQLLQSLKHKTQKKRQPTQPRSASPEPDPWVGHAFFLASSQPVPSI